MTHPWAIAIFWISIAWLAYVYVGYAGLLWLLAKLRPFRQAQSEEDYLPSISVLISARNEEKDIGWKVHETLAWKYPPEKLQVLVASDASDDGTDALLTAFHDPRFTFVRMERRGGKNIALQCLAKLAKGELLFFTDANSHIDTDSVRNMVRHFADSKVGCVTGVERGTAAQQSETIAYAGGAYLGYEAWINSLESLIGSVLVCDGSIFCCRRELFDTLDPELANDLEQPLRIGARGYKLLYEPKAWSVERQTSSLQQEFNRRRRICGQGFLGMWRLRYCLRSLRLLQFISRKLLRWLTLLPLVGVLATSVVLRGSGFFLTVLVAQAACYGLALAGWIVGVAGRSGGRVASVPSFFVLANIAAFVGVLETLFGRRYGVWEVATLSRGEENPRRVETSHA